MYVLKGSVRVKYAFDKKDDTPKVFDYEVYRRQGMGVEFYDRIRLANAKSQILKSNGDNNNHSAKGA